MTGWTGSKAEDELRRAMRSAIPVEDEEHVRARRQRLVGLIEREIQQVPLRGVAEERRRRVLYVGMAAAASLAIGLATSLLSSGSESLALESTSGKTSSSLASLSIVRGSDAAEQRSLQVGSTVTLGQSEQAHLALPAGTHMDLSDAGALELLRAETYHQSVMLSAGRLAVEVQEGVAKERHVEVKTPHAEVRVTGTRFVVNVETSGTGTPENTNVSVQRGEVLVSFQGGSVRLHQGESWNSQVIGALALPNQATEPPITPEPNPSASPQGGEHSLPQSTAKASPSRAQQQKSSLALQNALLEQAVSLERQGKVVQAEAKLSHLLRRFPQSPLRSTIQAERRRIQAKLAD